MNTRKLLSFRLHVAAAVVLLAAAGAGTASAHGFSAGGPQTTACPTYATTQPFRPWNDLGSYFIAPNADFEGSLTGWTVKNGKLVSGNESYYVNAPTDSHSLSLPKGATAQSPSICVTLYTPDLRVFLNNTGSSSATMTVNMTYTNNQGKASTATVAKISVPGKSAWTLSAPVLFLANIQSILSSNGNTWVSFTFSSGGTFLVDDFYVDPIKNH